jgi:hypothetical protein
MFSVYEAVVATTALLLVALGGYLEYKVSRRK